MKALVRDESGSSSVVRMTEVDMPVPRENEVLVRVHATSINDFDLFIFDLPWPFRLVGRLRRAVSARAPLPVKIAGCDIAGTVTAVGSGVENLRPGDAVFGDLSGNRFGAFAEYVCAPEDALALKPARMTFEQAAALPQAGVLAAQGLFVNGPLQPGQKILINGAGGGVGTIGVQLAKECDVEVTGVDRASKLDMMRSLGFDHVIDYQKEDFTKTGRRYDLIVDTKTNRSAFDYMRALTPNGTYATVGGKTARLLRLLVFSQLCRLFIRKKLVLIGLKPNKYLAYMSERFETGHLIPVIDGPYQLKDAPEAFRHFLAADHKGKIIITMG